MKTVHYFKIAVIFLVLGSLANMGCRASVDIGDPKRSSIQSAQTVLG